MEKILNQEEIDALFRAMRGGTVPGASVRPKARRLTPCNFRRGGQINKEQARSVGALHETFARNLGHSLAAYLRVVFDVNLVSVEQLSYAEFLQRVPETIYMASVNLQPLAAVGALQVDLALAFPIIDLLLGGQGKAEPQVRDLTEIEEQILESMVKIICRELQTTWQPLLELKFLFDQRQHQAQIQRLMAPDEKVLVLSFEVRMPETQGMLNLVFSAAVSSALLRRLSQQWSYRRQRAHPEADSHLRELLLGCRYDVELRLESMPVSARDLLGLEPGQVLALRQRIDDPVLLMIGGRRGFSADLVRKGNQRAAQLRRRLEAAPIPEKEKS